MASKIGKSEWKLVFFIAGGIDLIEFLTDLFLTEFLAAPEIVWTVVDRIIGVAAVAYFELRGVRILANMKRLFSLVGVQGAEFITGGAAPAWIIDVWYIHKTVKDEEAAEQAAQEQQEMLRNFQLPSNTIDEETGRGMRPPQLPDRSMSYRDVPVGEEMDLGTPAAPRQPLGGKLYSQGIGRPRGPAKAKRAVRV